MGHELGVDALEPHSGPAVLGHRVGGHVGALQRSDLFAHNHIQHSGPAHDHVDIHIFFGIVPETQQVLAGRQLQ